VQRGPRLRQLLRILTRAGSPFVRCRSCGHRVFVDESVNTRSARERSAIISRQPGDLPSRSPYGCGAHTAAPPTYAASAMMLASKPFKKPGRHRNWWASEAARTMPATPRDLAALRFQ